MGRQAQPAASGRSSGAAGEWEAGTHSGALGVSDWGGGMTHRAMNSISGGGRGEPEVGVQDW